MLTRKELHRLRGPAQLREDEAEKLFEYLKSFGVMSGQPRETFNKPISIYRDLVYLTETRREDASTKFQDWPWLAYDGPIQDWYNWYASRMNGLPPIKTDNPGVKAVDDKRSQDVVLAVGVHYPATPSTEFYTADGRYRFSIAGDDTAEELGKQLIELATTPRSKLLQTDVEWRHGNPNRYYTKTHGISEDGKYYKLGKGAWFEKSNGTLNEPAVFMESIDSAYNTNGHIFFIIGNPRFTQEYFNAINYKVIS